MERIAIIGSGTVGKATGLGFLAKGHDVVFYDVREDVIQDLVQEGYKAKHVDDMDITESVVFFLVVPTPTENGKINLQYIEDAARSLGEKLKDCPEYRVIVVRSTVLPKTTEDIVAPIVEKYSGKKCDVDFGVAMNPEYLREVNATDDFKNPWIITIGVTDERVKGIMQGIYENFSCPIHYVSITEAETQKYVHNLYNAVKIAFFNEMRLASHYLGIDADKIFAITAESAEAFWNKKYGLRDMGPFDGMCLPKDTQAFYAWSQDKKIDLDLLGGAITSNDKFAKFWENRES